MSTERYPARANVNWSFEAGPTGTVSYEAAQMIVMMDIREELRALNALLRCSNFQAIPAMLRGIKRNTTKRRRPLVKR